jgi:hypothetical protein
MSESLDHARRYHEDIRRILPREWDPIGASDTAAAQDEYDCYLHEIRGTPIRHEPRHELVELESSG